MMLRGEIKREGWRCGGGGGGFFGLVPLFLPFPTSSHPLPDDRAVYFLCLISDPRAA